MESINLYEFTNQKQQTTESIDLDEFTEDDFEVAQILVDLNEIHLKHWYFDPWTPKGKRCRVLDELESPPSIQLQIQEGGEGVGADGACNSSADEGSEPTAAAAVVESPNSRLEFSTAPSSTEIKEEKPEEEKTMVVSKSRGELKLEEKIEELKQTKKVLTGELERVMKFHKKLKDYNSLLGTKKEQVLSNKKKRPAEIRTSSGGMDDLRQEMSQFYKRTMVIPQNLPYIPDPTVPGFLLPSGPSTREQAAINGLNWASPRCFDFDLNLPPAEEEACNDCCHRTTVVTIGGDSISAVR